jgi:nicotinamidase-related amidase
MPTIDPQRSLLLVIDIQTRLMPAIHDGESVIRNAGRLIEKQSFDVCREAGFLDRIPADAHVVVAGCEAHVCVLQTVLGLRAAGRDVYVAGDAIGSRAPANREAALRRMERHGAETVTTEMVVFEWLQTALHPQFRSAVALIK